MLDYLQRNPTFLHPVYERQTDRMIGVMGWWEDDFGRPRLTYFISPSERQHGYAHEAYMAELKEFARHGAAAELIAQVAPENHASQNLLLKAGFHDAGMMVGDSGVLRGEEVILFRRDLSDLLPPAGPTVH
jgi:RimJ/RimL family protein N-acetyltransferase